MRRSLGAAGAALLILTVLSPLPARGEEAISSPNMSHIATFRGAAGTDLEFATIEGRDYAFAGSLSSGMRIFDITDPQRTRLVGRLDCSIGQGDVQVFRQGSRWLATYTADNGYSTGGSCYRQTGARRGTYGTFVVDVSDPTAPEAIGFIPVVLGSHNMTVHPGGRFLYNSDSELPGRGQVEIWDLQNPSDPVQLSVFDLLPVPGAVNDAPSSSHDITFNADGTRAYVAALTYTVVLDTSTPAAPVVLSRIADPAITLHHQSDPVTLQTPAGPLTYLVITDELGGGATNVCPGGGLHVYNITGPLELAPVKVGAFFVPFIGETPGGSCTSHVLRMHPDEAIMTIAWYGLGSRVIDISNLVGLSAGVDEAIGTAGPGLREVGFIRFADSDTWSAKTNRIAPDGSFYLYANDMRRGFEVLHFTPPADDLAAGRPGGIEPGRWLSPAEALEEALERRAADGSGASGSATLAPYCVLPEFS